MHDWHLFTGDILRWSHRRSEFDVTTGVDVVLMIGTRRHDGQGAPLSVARVFPGYGACRRANTKAEECSGLSALEPAMRNADQNVWAQRSNSPYDRGQQLVMLGPTQTKPAVSRMFTARVLAITG